MPSQPLAPHPPLRLAALIMAAGRGSRFDGCKPLATIGDRSLLQLAIDKTRQCGLVDIFVVTGAWHAAIAAAMAAGTLRNAGLIDNPDWERGLGRSIAVGVARVATDHDAVMILLADQIGLDAGELRRLIAAHTPGHIACARYAGRRGVPALFGREHFDPLTRLDGDQGARGLLRSPDTPVIEVDMENAAVDVDTPADLPRRP